MDDQQGKTREQILQEAHESGRRMRERIQKLPPGKPLELPPKVPESEGIRSVREARRLVSESRRIAASKSSGAPADS
jgi:hypothetical protein